MVQGRQVEATCRPSSPRGLLQCSGTAGGTPRTHVRERSPPVPRTLKGLPGRVHSKGHARPQERGSEPGTPSDFVFHTLLGPSFLPPSGASGSGVPDMILRILDFRFQPGSTGVLLLIHGMGQDVPTHVTRFYGRALDPSVSGGNLVQSRSVRNFPPKCSEQAENPGPDRALFRKKSGL